MYIQRDIDRTLSEWKEEVRRKPLMLRGVRQCGKTSAVRHLSESFCSYVEINLEKQPGICRLFDGDLDIRRIVSRLEIYAETRIEPGDTLLFIDEIQECPRAITALRYFYEEMPELHVIAAGSLLEFVLNGKTTKVDFPVGRIRSIYMYPLSFNEFLSGVGKSMLRDHLENPDYINERNEAHNELIEAYKTFLVVGGMPEAVAAYADTGSIFACQQIHRDIIANFMDDFNKYSSTAKPETIRKVFLFAIHNICSQTKASSAIPGLSAYLFDECVQLLRRAGLVYPIKASPCDTMPLGSSEKETNKKLIVFDTGVYLTECGLDTGEILDAKIFDEMNKGSVVEMSTGLEMLKYSSPYTEGTLYFWYRSGANAEVDYVIQKNSVAIPVEVKASGKGSMQSMHSFLDTHSKTPYGLRVSLENFCEYDRIKVVPAYAMCTVILNNKQQPAN